MNDIQNPLEKFIDKALSPEIDHAVNREKYRINVNEAIPPPQIAWSMLNTKDDKETPLGFLGDFGLVIGKAKSKKSFFINIAVSAALSDHYILDRFRSHLPKNQSEVIYFDTEQSKYYVQKAVKRICVQIKKEEPQNLHVFHLRSLSPSQRLKFIEEEIYSSDKIGFVVIDGVRDLIQSINDESEASMVASKFLKWTEERNIYILSVLHQNPTNDKARGHIGTELINKAQTVLSITKSETDEKISIVEPQQCRDKEPETFAFEIDAFSIPIVAENYEMRTETRTNKFDVSDLDDFKKIEILKEVFTYGESFSYTSLRENIQIAYQNQFKAKLGDNRAKQLIAICRIKEYVLQEKPKGPWFLGKIDVLTDDDDIVPF